MEDELVKKRIESLVDDFRMNYDEYRKESEASIETKLIEPLFKCLGWTEKDFKKREQAPREGRRGFADYTFYIGDKKVFFLEVKRIGIPLDKEADMQVVSYALSKSVPIAISTNFEQLKVFCVEEENISKRKIIVFNEPEEYTKNYHDLLLLSKSSFDQNLLIAKAENLGLLKKRITIDKPLLDDLILIRKFIADDIEKNYPEKYQPNEKEEITQRIIDRLIFMRKCEDSGINPKNLILKDAIAVPDNKAYTELKDLFKEYHTAYNSGLFDIDKDNECDKIRINGDIIKKLIKYLYISKNEGYYYNFEWIPADILGQVYEQYLGKILEQTKSGRAKLTNGQAHRKEQGIYYTPTYIVDYIVKNTIGEILKNKKIKLKDIKVLDPACGSGSFLIKAFDYLNEFLSSDLDSRQYRIDSQGKYSIKTEILKNNLFGVDLDNKAIEITKLNLLLKAAEKNRQLPEEIDLHIRQGNSLIDDESIAQLNAFKWRGDFKEGSFDVIIGNPPYVRIQTLNKDEVEYFNKNYESPTKNYDIYILFIEKGFKLLKENGILGLILPHKFFQGEMGENIRRFIHETKSLYKIVDFTTNQVFENATTYTCLLFLTKKKNSFFYYKRFELDDDFEDLHEIEFEKKDIKILKEDKWNFSSNIIQQVLTKITSQKYSFEDITKKIFKGSSTGNDDIFLLDPIAEKKNTYIVFSKKLDQKVEIEKQLLRSFFYGEDIRRYAPLVSNKLLLYPYVPKDDKVQLIPLEEMKKEYPLAYEYLHTVKGDLEKRKIETDYKNFYKFSAARSLLDYTQPKIMIPDMLVSNRINYDEQGTIYHGPAIHSIVFNEKIKGQNPLFYIAILNSKLFWFFISHTSTALRGNAYRLTPEFVNPFCFPAIDMNKQGDRKIHDNFVLLANKMFSLNKQLYRFRDKKTSESAKLEDEIKKTDNEIDQLVYNLYGLTKEEIAVIEERLKE